MKKYFFLFLLIIVSFLSCKKNTEQKEEVLYQTGALITPENILYDIPIATPPSGSGSLPDTFDLSINMPPVRSQGSQGSCASWATGYYLKSYYEKINSNSNYGHGNNYDGVFSPAFLYNSVKEYGDCSVGSYTYKNLDRLKQTGICYWNEMPYNQSNCTTDPSQEALISAGNYKIEKYSKIWPDPDINNNEFVNRVKSFISSNIPVIIDFTLDYDFHIGSPKINGVYIYNSFNSTPENVGNNHYPGYHTVCIVGYDDNKNAFKGINSWGDNWGNNGYFWIDYNLFSQVVHGAFKITDGGSSISINPNNLYFGYVQINTSSQQKSFTVTNNGTTDFYITNIDVPSGFALLNGQSTVVHPSDVITLYVTFNPTQVQSYNGTITIENNANSGSNTISLTGNGVDNNSGNSVIQITPNNLNFSNTQINTTSSQEQFTISNSGDIDFNVSNITSSNNSVFHIVNGQSGVITPTGSMTIYVTFNPTQVQNYNGTITIENDADSGNSTISATGTGIDNSGYSDLIVDEIWVEDEGNNEWDINVRIKNIGSEATPNSEDININYYVDGNLVGSDTENPLNPNETGTKYLNNYEFSFNGNHDIEVIIEPVSNENDTSNNSSIISFDNSGSSGTPITPTNNCASSPIMDINTVYTITNLDVSQFDLAYPIDNESYQNGLIRGFYVSVNVPNSGSYKIKIYDVSNNFDPVIGVKVNCTSGYYSDMYTTNTYRNDNGYGGNETFYAGNFSSSNTYNCRIYHYYGDNSPTISFKIEVVPN